MKNVHGIDKATSDFDEFKENFHRYSQYKDSQRHGEENKRQSKLLEEQAKKAEMKADARWSDLRLKNKDWILKSSP